MMTAWNDLNHEQRMDVLWAVAGSTMDFETQAQTACLPFDVLAPELAKRVAEMLAREDGAQAPKKVSHGSPHRFDPFLLDYGQGALAHGWGLYFSRRRAAAGSYQRPQQDGAVK